MQVLFLNSFFSISLATSPTVCISLTIDLLAILQKSLDPAIFFIQFHTRGSIE